MIEMTVGSYVDMQKKYSAAFEENKKLESKVTALESQLAELQEWKERKQEQLTNRTAIELTLAEVDKKKIIRLESQLAVAREALKDIKEKTKTDPAEGPELLARAAIVYGISSQALSKIGEK